MSLFKKLFGKPETPTSKETGKGISREAKEEFDRILKQMSGSPKTPEQFKIELYDSIKRYFSTPELEVKLNLTDENGIVFKEHEAFGGTYGEWQQIISAWDRRGLLFKHWDETEFEKLDKWQVIERYVKDRYGMIAINYHQENITDQDFQDIRLFVSLSKLYRVLDSVNDALNFAKEAYKLRPDLDIVKVEYATVLHINGTHSEKELAHKLISEVLEKRVMSSNEDTLGLLNYFIFSPDYLDSSIFALLFLQSGNADLKTWDLLAEEYYYCPFFRYEHSVFLSNNGEPHRAIAKISSLANEFPWYKTGVLANIDSIIQLRKQGNDPNYMKEEMDKMEKYKSMWVN